MNVKNISEEIVLNLEAIKYKDYKQEKIDSKIDKEKILSEQERSLYENYCVGNNLRETAIKYNSNIETVRQKLHLIAIKLNPEKKLKKIDNIRS
jgi:hypothetical protein